MCVGYCICLIPLDNGHMGLSSDGYVYTKTDERHPQRPYLEACGLAWLGEAMEDGGAHVVPPRYHDGVLQIPVVPHSSCTPEAARAFGRALALTHAAGAPWWGAPPTGWSGLGWMGESELTYPNTSMSSWGVFYANERLRPNMALARDRGTIGREGLQILEKVCQRLEDKEFDSPLPALISAPAARLHGDLWTGNIVWSPRSALPWAPARAGKGPQNTDSATDTHASMNADTDEGEGAGVSASTSDDLVGVLIDPAAQGGHAETDLATLTIFDQPYADQIYVGYQDVSPLAPGWRERIGLHQLHMLIIHAVLFGGGYGEWAVRQARPYV